MNPLEIDFMIDLEALLEKPTPVETANNSANQDLIAAMPLR